MGLEKKPTKTEQKSMVIGVDPGHTIGTFIFKDGKPFSGVSFDTFWEAIAFFEEHKHATFIIEDPRKNKPVFGVNYAIQKIRKGGFSIDTIKRELNAFAKKGQNVGMVKENAKVIIDFMEFMGINHYSIKPIKGMKEDASKQAFRFYVKDIKTRKNQHVQDAFWCAFYHVNKPKYNTNEKHN